MLDRSVAGVLLLIPIVAFWFVWNQYAVNVPKWDDHVLRAFLFNLDNETSVSGKIYQFFKQHNEHRIVYDRVVTWVDFSLFGKLSYRHLTIVGNLSLLGILVIFGNVLGRSIAGSGKDYLTNGLFYLAPVAFLLLNLSHWENMFWGMASLQNFTVMLWVFWSIYLLAFTERIWPAFLLAIAATLTSGNGLLVWPIGFAILLVQFLSEKRPYRWALLIWAVGAIGLITLYFYDYQKPPGNPAVRGTFFDLLKGWLAFNGAAAEAFPIATPFAECLILGGIITALVLFSWLYCLEKGLIIKRFSSFTYFFVATTAFLLVTAATVAWSRVGFGMNGLITSRYKLYSLLLLSLIYSFTIVQQQRTGRTWAFYAGLVFSFILMGSSYLTYLSDTTWLRQWSLTNQFNWTHNANNPTISIDSVSKHYTSLAPAFYDRVLPAIFGPTNQTAVPIKLAKTPDEYSVSNTTMPPLGLVDAGNYILARSGKRSYLFPVRQQQQPIRRALVQPGNLLLTGFQTHISPAEMNAGTYQLFILAILDNKAIVYPTNQTIESAGPPATTLKKNW